MEQRHENGKQVVESRKVGLINASNSDGKNNSIMKNMGGVGCHEICDHDTAWWRQQSVQGCVGFCAYLEEVELQFASQ